MRDMEYDRRVSVFVMTCGREIDGSSIMCYLYFAQRLGFNLGFNFRASYGGVTSRKAEGYLNELLVSDFLSYDSTTARYTYQENSKRGMVRVAGEDLDLLDNMYAIISDLSSWELSFVATLDILQDEVRQRQLSEDISFEDAKDSIVTSMKRLCPRYTDELFEAASERLLNLYKLKERN